MKHESTTISNNNDYLDKLVATAWTFSYSVLWNGETFSIKETHTAKRIIRYHISNSDNLYDAYLEFCQRVLLAWEYVNKEPDRFIPRPALWLCPDNRFGYMGTESWFEYLKLIRRSLPLYRHQFKALPEAIMEMQDEPTAANFHYWRTWFLERSKQRALNLFLCVLANGKYML
jgi:hypothetical protein